MDQEQQQATERLVDDLNQVEMVVADSNKFKLKLGIGEDAYTSQKLLNVYDLFTDAKSAFFLGSTGAGFAATLIPAAKVGLMTKAAIAVGLATAPATAPLALVATAAAGIASGGVYFGAMRAIKGGTSRQVETIPKFINTPIDILGATLFDMIAGLALKVASFSGPVDESEREAVVNYFSEEWGISTDYARKALPLLELQIRDQSLKAMAKSLADFQLDNPDCEPDAMRKVIKDFLIEIAEADGEHDEAETLAIDAVEREFAAALSTQAKLTRKAGQYSSKATDMAKSGGSAVSAGARTAFQSLRGRMSREK
ncbi:tellurite resistance TerB family protein [Paracoccus jeotgali]|uniref:Co-chaperone DjlA N-terminal domain-containing protein n=1 Tax=Paracoccus jeotgali TaxID=2065379 RepID=A0A2K9MEU1_9RHOB|nr:TerB family tellurite resistance protein [Paracoccus jeotgali]AUM74140.1 hypothetical protein CYR75_07530 [Paracoccus jeotgali]